MSNPVPLGETILTPGLYQGVTALYTFGLTDEMGEDIADGELTTMTLTYYDTITEQILNSRENQDVFNVNDVFIETIPGNPLQTTVTWTMQPADTVMVREVESEYHTIVFRWTWDSGARHGAHRVYVAIHNLPHEP